ncbi:MAG: rod-binding protein [Oricola sp.]|nr:rod-binding protein [Oricola sp.]
MTGALPIGGVDASLASRSAHRLDAASTQLRLGQTDDKAQTAAKQFESVFLSQFFSMMFSGIDTNGMFGGGSGEQMWRGFLIDHIADAYAERGGIGLSSAVMSKIVEMSEPGNE